MVMNTEEARDVRRVVMAEATSTVEAMDGNKEVTGVVTKGTEVDVKSIGHNKTTVGEEDTLAVMMMI